MVSVQIAALVEALSAGGETALLDEAGVAKAAVESVLENGHDAVFGALEQLIRPLGGVVWVNPGGAGTS